MWVVFGGFVLLILSDFDGKTAIPTGSSEEQDPLVEESQKTLQDMTISKGPSPKKW